MVRTASRTGGEAAVLWIRFCALLLVSALVIVGASFCEKADEEEVVIMAGGLMGAPKDVKGVENSVEIDDIAKFAVSEHNAKEGKNLTLKKVVSAKTQVVSGIMYHLKIEACHEASEQPKAYDAKVWIKSWENHKSLEHFKEADEGSQSVSVDTQQSGLREVSVEDPVIKEAAGHALKGLNDKSNSLVPYELKNILSAHAEAGDEETTFELCIKVQRGTKEEEVVKSGVHRTAAGHWSVKHSATV